MSHIDLVFNMPAPTPVIANANANAASSAADIAARKERLAAKLAAHIATSESCTSTAVERFIVQSRPIRWSHEGRHFLIRLVNDADNTRERHKNWPLVWLGREGQIVNAAVWCIGEGEEEEEAAATAIAAASATTSATSSSPSSSSSSTPRLVCVWCFSSTGDETNRCNLKEYEKSIWTLVDIIQEGTKEQKIALLGTDQYQDAFSCSSGDETVEQFYCPALERMTLADILQEGKSEAVKKGSLREQ